jgi:hypothetical protein
MDLRELEKIQLDCSKRVILEDGFEKLELVGGMDLTFEDIKKTPTRAWASLVVLELKSLRPIYQKVMEGVVDFPYIPTFLAFREMPLMLELYKEAKVKADVYFIDGQGIAHPRGGKNDPGGKGARTTPKARELFSHPLQRKGGRCNPQNKGQCSTHLRVPWAHDQLKHCP